ncbi:hypothetical protein ANAEL_02458 [Anaerolineales bacterium]|nr:hypothetical protein ANAEL_02458 [Anaerolineales bacterium]
MIVDILRKRNLELQEDVETLLTLVKDARVPLELESYQMLVVGLCEYAKESISKNLRNIDLNRDDILEDIFSDVQQTIILVKLISDRFSVPIIRAMPSDRLCLSILSWVHGAHAKTKDFPPAINDGSVSVLPVYPQVYMFPQLEKRSLLYQPLLFHEFGHVLYACHKQELDSLVKDLQGDVTEIILPRSQRNDRHSEIQATRRQTIADTWYGWIQELFCDAVGFRISGPSFLHAFSVYLGVVNRNHFYRAPKDLALSEHPVTWLRVHFLADLARNENQDKIAHNIESEWSIFAEAMGIQEDYHGYYDKSLTKVVKNTIADMLTETDPKKCTKDEMAGGGWEIGESPIRLLNWAWQMKLQKKLSFKDWEKSQIDRYLKLSTFRIKLDEYDRSFSLVDSMWKSNQQ